MDQTPSYEELLERVALLEEAEQKRKERYDTLKKNAVSSLNQPGGSPKNLISDLQVYQVELEIQNEELRDAQTAIEKSRDRFVNLFHQSPVGYVVLDSIGMIVDANHTFAFMLNEDRANLIQKPLSGFLLEEDRHIFFSRYTAFFKQPDKKIIEARVSNASDRFFYARLEGRLMEVTEKNDIYSGQLLMAVIDITEIKEAEQREQHVKQILKIGREINQLISTTNEMLPLINRVCQILTRWQGYYNAWIALIPEKSPYPDIIASAGFGSSFKVMEDALRQGKYPRVMQKALDTSETVIVQNPFSVCDDCPLAQLYLERTGFVRRLEYGDEVYGVLVVSAEKDYLGNKEEVELFEQISRDLSMGIHKVESEEQLRRLTQIVKRVPYPMSILNTDYEYTAVNDIYSDFFQKTGKEIIGNTPEQLLGETLFKNVVKPRLDRCLSGETVHYEQKITTPGKNERVMNMSYFPYRDQSGEVTGVIVHGVDMTELHDSERRLRKIIDSTPLGICITDKNGFFESVNPAYCKLYKYDRSELIGKHFTVIVAEENKEILTRLHDDFIRGEHELRGEWEVVDRLGKPISIIADAARIVGSDGAPRKVTFVLDITERKELERLKEDIDRIMRHDLKQPLNAIIGYPQIVEMKGDINEKQREILDIIVDSGEKMLHMIEASLDMFKMETGNYYYQSIPLNLLEILNQVLGAFESRLSAKHIDLHVSWNGRNVSTDDRIMIMSDSSLLYSLLSNLVANAVEASQPGDPIRFKTVEVSAEPLIFEFRIENCGVVPLDMRDDFFGKYKTSGKKEEPDLEPILPNCWQKI